MIQRESPAIVTLMTGEEIRNSGARDMIDVFRLIPGFSFGLDVYGLTGICLTSKLSYLNNKIKCGLGVVLHLFWSSDDQATFPTTWGLRTKNHSLGGVVCNSPKWSCGVQVLVLSFGQDSCSPCSSPANNKRIYHFVASFLFSCTLMKTSF